VTIFTLIFDLLFGALGDASPGVRAVPGIAGDGIHLHGMSERHGEFSALDMYFGGWGARADRDGIDGVAPVYMGSFGSTSVEILEQKLPVVVEEFGLVADSEGAGTYRGSLQVTRTWRLLEGADVMVRCLNLTGTEGMAGGAHGLPPHTDVVDAVGARRVLERRSHLHFRGLQGDRVRHVTASPGGFGDPFARDASAVVRDVSDGKVSRAGARERYGVVIDAHGVLDVAATSAVRAPRR
jgi:N-methylhydantoinase B